MSYLLDTTVLIGWFRGYRNETEFIGQHQETTLYISTITYGEFYEGIFKDTHPEVRVRRTIEILSLLEVIPVGIAISRKFGELRARLRRDGQLFGDMDVLIAATALEHDYELVTSNMRHFGRLPELRATKI